MPPAMSAIPPEAILAHNLRLGMHTNDAIGQKAAADPGSHERPQIAAMRQKAPQIELHLLTDT